MFRITQDLSSESLLQYLAKITRLPDDGSSVIRNMLEHFQYSDTSANEDNSFRNHIR